MQHPETMLVKRKSDGLEHLINVEDFNDELHLKASTLLTPPKASKKAAEALTPAPVPQPPVNNEHIAPGTEQFTPEVIAANESGQGGAPGDGDGSNDGNQGDDGQSQQQSNGGSKPTLSVEKTGSKYFVIDQNGNKYVADGINPKGYKTDAEAWAAVMAVA